MGRRCGSDPTLLWLWHRLAATTWIRPLAWEPPYAMGMALERAKRQKKKLKILKIKNKKIGVPVVAQQLTNLTSIHEDVGSIPGLTQWIEGLVLL